MYIDYKFDISYPKALSFLSLLNLYFGDNATKYETR